MRPGEHSSERLRISALCLVLCTETCICVSERQICAKVHLIGEGMNTAYSPPIGAFFASLAAPPLVFAFQMAILRRQNEKKGRSRLTFFMFPSHHPRAFVRLK